MSWNDVDSTRPSEQIDEANGRRAPDDGARRGWGLMLLAAVAGMAYLAVTYAPGLVATTTGLSVVTGETLVVVSVAVLALIVAVRIAALILKVLFVLLIAGAIVYALNHRDVRQQRHHRPATPSTTPVRL